MKKGAQSVDQAVRFIATTLRRGSSTNAADRSQDSIMVSGAGSTCCGVPPSVVAVMT
jgi:hypothetical protein